MTYPPPVTESPDASPGLCVRPRMTICVGVTGHLPKDLRDKGPLIQRLLKDVFEAIDTTCRQVKEEDSKKRYGRCYSDASYVVRTANSLAAGADLMAAQAMPADWQLNAILPFPADYLRANDLASTADGQEAGWQSAFDEAIKRSGTITTTLAAAPRDEGDRHAGYVRASQFLLKNIDILVAVWNGKAGQGDGGTAWNVDKALENGIPVIWIDATGEITVARVLHSFGLPPTADGVDATLGPIDTILRQQLAPPSQKEPWSEANARLQEFFEEAYFKSVTSHVLAVSYYCLVNIANGKFWKNCVLEFLKWCGNAPLSAEGTGLGLACKSQHAEKDKEKFLTTFLRAKEDFSDSKRNEQIQDLIHERYIVTDQLATYYGNLYRSAYVTAYLLSSVAVLLALIGLFAYDAEHKMNYSFKLGLIGAELFIIGYIYYIVTTGRRRRWHHRWLEYRALAEMLRHLRFLAPIAEYGSIRSLALKLHPRPSAWVNWYVRATLRELGLPPANVSPSYQWNLIQAVNATEIESQIAYHRNNHARLKTVQHRLHKVGLWLAALIFMTLLMFLLLLLVQLEYVPIPSSLYARVTWFLEHKSAFVTLIAAFGPALGAALAGIRFTGDFEGFAERSLETQRGLEALHGRIESSKDLVTVEHTSRLLGDVAGVLAEDVAGWRTIYGRKHLDLPG